MAAEYTFTDNGNSVTVTSTLTQSMALDFPKNSVLISKHKLGSRTVLRFTVYGFVALDVDHSQIIAPATADIDADLVALRDFFNPSSNNALVVTDTYANWEAARIGATLIPGTTVVVSDRGDLGIQLTAVTESQFSFAGMGGFLNPDWQGVGDYSGVSGFTAAMGLWNSVLDGALVDGNVVIWNNSHFVVVIQGSLNGSGPETNTTAYTKLSRVMGGAGYIEEWCMVEFDFTNNIIQRRVDSRGNDVKMTKAVADVYGWTAADGIPNFKWGSNIVIGNAISEARCDIRNFGGEFKQNIAAIGSDTNNISGAVGAAVSGNRLAPNTSISNIQLGDNSYIKENELQPTSAMYSLNLANNGFSSVYRCLFLPQGNLGNQTFGIGAILGNAVIGNSITTADTISSSIVDKRTESGYSNFEATIDIGTAMDVIYSGLAGGPFEVGEAVEFDTLETGTITADAAGVLTIDRNGTPCYGATTVTQTTGTNAGASANVGGQYARLMIPSEKVHCGIIKVVSGNSEEVVNAVYGHPTAFDYIVKPSTVSGVMAKLTLVHTAFSPLVADSVCLSDGTTILELLSNSDSAVFRDIAGRNGYVDSSQLGQ